MKLKPIAQLDGYCTKLDKFPLIEKMFKQCFLNTYDTTTELLDDGTSYVFTGDIPAMWLRDSSAQVSPYLFAAAGDDNLKEIIKGLLRRQWNYIKIDPYANAFNKEANGRGHKDKTKLNDWVWERKFELDSLCYPLWLAFRYYEETKDTSIFDKNFFDAVNIILNTFETEQHHVKKSDYSFIREGEYSFDTLPRDGKGDIVPYTGMVWSAFRPSDDKCKYNYFIPGNIFIVVVLKSFIKLFSNCEPELSARADKLANEIEDGIKKYGIVNHKDFGKIYAYETDGLGNYIFMDDANVPSLLSLPYLGYCENDDELYQNTRKFILSNSNPYYFHGKAAKGVGSPHTPHNYVWHIALIMQGLTSSETAEKKEILSTLLSTHADTFYMHEGFDCNDPSRFTRSWFAWANSLFAIFIIKNIDIIDELI